jgi:hypothetical protein
MAAVDGLTHVSLLEQVDTMEKRRWPASTEKVSHFKIDLSFEGEKYLMVALDYPGEVFRRAFMEGADEPAVRELLDNVDRAAAVIVLVDPGVAFDGNRMNDADQDFGLVAAIKRIRDWPGAEDVPVAITLTKCDRYRTELESEGGITAFVRKHYPNLFRAVFQGGRNGMVFSAAAVRVRTDGLGKEAPDLTKPPLGLTEPLEYCLKMIRERRAARARADQKAFLEQRRVEQAAAEAAADQRTARFHAMLIVGCILLVVVAGVVAWRLVAP